MDKLCLSTFFKILINAKNLNKASTQKGIVSGFLSLLTDDFDDSDPATSKLANGFHNPSAHLIKEANKVSEDKYSQIVSDYKKKVAPLLNPNKLIDAERIIEVVISEDDKIEDNTIIDQISGIRKRELTGTVNDIDSFLVGVFLYAIRNTNNIGERGEAKHIVDSCSEQSVDYVFPAYRQGTPKENGQKSVNSLLNSVIYDEQIEQKATAFGIRYDSQKGLIPICQILYLTNPGKKHHRAMYNSFCRLAKTTRDKIIEAADIYLIDDISERNWWYEYLGQFEKDYKRFELGEDRYLYMFGQYFPDLIEFGDKPVDEYLTRVFSPKVDSIPGIPDYKVDMLYLIDEYIHYREDKNYRSVLEPPVDFLARELDFPGCPDEALAAYLSFIIIGTCCAIPKGRPENCTVEKTSGVSIYDIETAEDLFYFTLLKLYETYNEVVEKRQDQCEN